MYFIGGRFEKRPYRGFIQRVYSGSEEFDACLGALSDLLFGPDGCLDFADVGFVEEEHAEAALADASADGVRQTAFDEHFVEGEFPTFGAATNFELLDE